MSEHSVAKIIRSEDFQNFIKEQQERLFAIAPVAIESFRARVAADGNLAFAFLKDIGIIPSREALVTMMTPAPSETETGEERQARMIGALLLEGHKNFGVDLPEDVAEALAEKSRESMEGANLSQPKLPRR